MKRKVKKNIKKQFNEKNYYYIVEINNGKFSCGGIKPNFDSKGKVFSRQGDAKRSWLSYDLDTRMNTKIIKIKGKAKKIKII